MLGRSAMRPLSLVAAVGVERLRTCGPVALRADELKSFLSPPVAFTRRSAFGALRKASATEAALPALFTRDEASQ